jgi:hypothetical protein
MSTRPTKLCCAGMVMPAEWHSGQRLARMAECRNTPSKTSSGNLQSSSTVGTKSTTCAPWHVLQISATTPALRQHTATSSVRYFMALFFSRLVGPLCRWSRRFWPLVSFSLQPAMWPFAPRKRHHARRSSPTRMWVATTRPPMCRCPFVRWAGGLFVFLC